MPYQLPRKTMQYHKIQDNSTKRSWVLQTPFCVKMLSLLKTFSATYENAATSINICPVSTPNIEKVKMIRARFELATFCV